MWSLASERVVLGDKIVPARLHIEGSVILRVETCSVDAYPSMMYRWQEEGSLVLVNKLVSPAFVNGHTHLAMSFLRQGPAALHSQLIEDYFFRLEQHLEPGDVLAFARMGAYENLLHGVALVWDHYYYASACAQALEEVGLCGVVAGTLQDLSGPGKSRWEAELEESLTVGGVGVFPALGPHASDTVSADLWRQVIAAAGNLPLHFHLAQTYDEYQFIKERESCSPLIFLRDLGVFDKSCLAVHNTFVDGVELAALQAANLTLGFCPFSAVVFAIPALVNMWEKLGKNWLVGTDCVASNDSMNVQKELRYLAAQPMQACSYGTHYKDFLEGRGEAAAVEQERLACLQGVDWERDPAFLLRRVWGASSRMHPRFKVGELKAGYLANIVFWDLNHPAIWPGDNLRALALADPSPGIYALLSAGRWIGVPGKFQEFFRGEVFLAHQIEAQERYARLCQRSGVVTT